MIKKTCALLILTFGMFSQEIATHLPPVEVKKPSDLRTLWYASCIAPVILPGFGVSIRENSWAVDATLYSVIVINSAKITYSKMWYGAPKEDQSRNYCGVGVGPVAIFSLFPSVETVKPGITMPVRFGKEYKQAFFDAGIAPGVFYSHHHSKHRFYPYIIPEIRGGFRF